MKATRPPLIVCACVCACAIAIACGDAVVGSFDATSTGATPASSGPAGESTTDPTSGGATTDTTDTTGETTSNPTGDPGFIPPGCFGDNFDNGVIDPLWNTWMEEDSILAEARGRLELTPPSFGIWDTGVVGAYNYVFPFVDAHVRLRVPVPPATTRPVLLVLTVGDGIDTTLSIQLASGLVIASAGIGDVEMYREEFPVAVYPAWIRLRAEGAVVHFEVSDDGDTFMTLTTRDKLAEFASAHGLIMAQTFGDDLDRSLIAVDDFEACVQ